MCHALTAHRAWPRRIEYCRVAPIYDSYARTRSWHNQARTCCTALQGKVSRSVGSWWRHQMETFSALRAICAGYSLVSGEFPAQRPVTRSFYVFFDLRLNKRLKKQSRGWWFETLSHPLWRQCNAIGIFCFIAELEGGRRMAVSFHTPVRWSVTHLLKRKDHFDEVIGYTENCQCDKLYAAASGASFVSKWIACNVDNFDL